jgi:hypothetical protein
VHFLKYDFEECVRRLREEINNIVRKLDLELEQQIDIAKPNDTAYDIDLSIENKWSHNEVENWFKEKSLNALILDELKPCDAKVLKQLNTILKSAPEFFYKALKNKKEISLRDVGIFT